MTKIVMIMGLPASGKSTFARELVDEGYKRVNKDDLRSMIDSSKFSKVNELHIKMIEKQIAMTYLTLGYNVVVDDTNYNYEDYWREIAIETKSEFEVKEFKTPVQECIRRDSLRGDKSVGSDVIWSMYRKYIEPHLPTPGYDVTLPDAVICDLDGTLALMKGRNPFNYDRVDEDWLNENIANIIDIMSSAGKKVIIVSGRDDSCLDKTMGWLDGNKVKFDAIYMRKTGDKRKDVIVKQEIYDEHIKGKYNITAVLDDRDSVVSMWRDNGLTTLQVNYGNF